MIIFRYLAKEIGAILLATSGILLLIFMSTQFIHFMRSAATGDLTAHTVLLLLSLEIPTLLGILLPLALFLGILLGFGRMYADNEMTVLFACGVSRTQLAKVTMSLALVIMVIVAGLMLWISPHVNKYAENLLNKGALSPLELVVPGRFQEFKSGQWVFYAGKTSYDHKHLQNIFVAERNVTPGQQNKGAWSILTARSGQQRVDKKTGNLFFVLSNGSRYLGVPGQKDYRIINFSQYWVRIMQLQDEQKHKYNAIPTVTLWSDSKHDNHAAAELQWRLSVPLMVLILTLMALPLSHVETRHGRYAQLVPAMLLYIIYGNFMFLGRSWVRSGVVSHSLGMWWIHGVMLLIAIVLIIRQMGWRRIIRVFHR